MNDAVLAIMVLLWALIVGFAYIRIGKMLPKIAAEGTPDWTPTCTKLAHLLLVSSFGTRFWTWRGLLLTTALSWGYALLLFLAYEGPIRFGGSGYPVFEYIVLGVMTLLPVWVHAIIHATRVFLEVVEASPHWRLRICTCLLLPIAPAIALAITLFLVAVVTGVLDSQRFTLGEIGAHWIELTEMATVTWWSPRETGSFPLVFIPLALPAISCGLHVASYLASFFLFIPRQTPTGNLPLAGRRNIFVTGMFHVSFILCWSIVFLSGGH